MRFFTVPNAQQARISVIWAMAHHRRLLRADADHRRRRGAECRRRDHRRRSTRAATWPGRCSRSSSAAAPTRWLGNLFLAFVAAVAFATIVAVVAGLVLASAQRMSHDIWVGIIKGEHATQQQEVRAARISALIVGAAGDRRSASSPRARTSRTWWRSPSRSRPPATSPRAAHAVLEALQYRRPRARHAGRRARRHRAGAGVAQHDLSAARNRKGAAGDRGRTRRAGETRAKVEVHDAGRRRRSRPRAARSMQRRKAAAGDRCEIRRPAHQPGRAGSAR